MFNNSFISMAIFTIAFTLLAVPITSAFGQEKDKWVTTYNTMALKKKIINLHGYPTAMRYKAGFSALRALKANGFLLYNISILDK